MMLGPVVPRGFRRHPSGLILPSAMPPALTPSRTWPINDTAFRDYIRRIEDVYRLPWLVTPALVGSPLNASSPLSVNVITVSGMSNTAGNTLIGAARWTSTASASTADDTGGVNSYTLLTPQVESTNCGVIIFYAPNIGANGSNAISVHLSGATTYRALTVAEFSGVAISSPLDLEATGATGMDAFPLTAVWTTTNANDLLIGACGIEGFPTLSPNAGYAFLGPTVSQIFGMEYQAVSTIQTAIQSGFGLDGSQTWVAKGAAFKAAASASGSLFSQCRLAGIGDGGPFFQNPLQ